MCFKIIHGPACSDVVPSKEADSCLFFFFLFQGIVLISK